MVAPAKGYIDENIYAKRSKTFTIAHSMIEPTKIEIYVIKWKSNIFISFWNVIRVNVNIYFPFISFNIAVVFIPELFTYVRTCGRFQKCLYINFFCHRFYLNFMKCITEKLKYTRTYHHIDMCQHNINALARMRTEKFHTRHICKYTE